MAKKNGLNAYIWSIYDLHDEMTHVHVVRDTLLDALAARLLQIPEDAITDIADRRLALTDAEYAELAERNEAIGSCMLLGKITDVLKGRYTSISVQEALLMCRRVGLRPRITFDPAITVELKP